MRVAVLGVGAIGGLVASRLARAGCEVLLCARGETAQALAAVGLLLDTPVDARRRPGRSSPPGSSRPTTPPCPPR